MNLLPFIPGYNGLIYDAGRQPALIMLTAFLITFLITRWYTRMARKTGWGSASFGGVHAHHLVFGLVIAFAAASLEFAFLPPANSLIQLGLAALFGTGAALVLDEFALIFHLKDVYWEDEGRKSIDAVVIGVIFGLLFLLHSAPFGNSNELPRAIVSLVQLFNLVFVVIAALKGKIYFAIIGVFLPILAIVGALRLAEPDSAWARKFYPTNSRKLKASVARYKYYEATWRQRKERARDIIGGKTGRPAS